MFYGDMADKSKVIRIPDIAPIGFENLLRYAYTGTIIINNNYTFSLKFFNFLIHFRLA